MHRRHRLLAGFHDDVGWAVAVALGLPVERVATGGRRHVGGVALRRALIDPADDRVDLLVGERHVVLELLHADAAVDVPRRHLARRHALADRTGPRPRVLIGDERHRRDRSRLVAGLTLGLENRRDVFRERHGFRGFSGPDRPSTRQQEKHLSPRAVSSRPSRAPFLFTGRNDRCRQMPMASGANKGSTTVSRGCRTCAGRERTKKTAEFWVYRR